MNGHNGRHGRGRVDGSAGLALLELVTALFIVTLGMFGVIDLYLRVMDNGRAVQQYALASRILQSEMELVRAGGAPALEPGSTDFRGEYSALERLSEAQGSIEVAVPDPDLPALRQVTVRLQWAGQHGRIIEKKLMALLHARS
ncbi:MAG: hypothetical protein HYV26_20990 [Candidatus Hydrogenedentes bacterium]|nr:hypothetical protein [Candidatus Hydrogenedentota bacterium]